ncbi:Dehydrin COR47 [Bienertia sinuspersici]
MADERISEAAPGVVETTDRGLFDFMKKKEDETKPSSDYDNISSGVEKVHVSEPECKKEESDEEGDDEEKKKRRKEKKEKKAGLKEKIEDKLGGGHHKEEHDTNVPIEKVHIEPSYTEHAPVHHHHEQEEKKEGGFIDKIKDKLPGQHADEEAKVEAPVVSHHEPPCAEEEKEKKGFLDKIKEKIPGFHSKNGGEEKKDHEEKKESY